MDAKTEALTDGWQAEAEEQARALTDRAGIESMDDYHDFMADLESTLLEFAEWTHSALAAPKRKAETPDGETRVSVIRGIDHSMVKFWPFASEEAAWQFVERLGYESHLAAGARKF